MNFVKPGERKRILASLHERYGISQVSGTLLETGKQKIRLFSGTMTKEELQELAGLVAVEVVGLYIVSREKVGFRIGLDGTTMLGKYATQHVHELSAQETEHWMKGGDILVKLERGIWIVKHGSDFLGCGVSNGEKLINYVPKERRIRKS